VVIKGQQLGRKLGIPTANIQPEADALIPAHGVYAVNVYIGTDPTSYAGVANIGLRPTVNTGATGNGLGTLAPVLEVHLLAGQWCADGLYGKTLTVAFQHYLRPEQRFDGLEALKQQIQQDAQMALQRLAV
jgi:riboflavin kinase/FMN adenylyltransferase